ncbi:hypothetical protein [Niveispirillum sp. KHB5.9]|uniref:hypothetical protein n=1 Tax=Niveispirillum sp. KHB5.9 TaxID=3400269 RepID=UPI003A84557A
MSNSHNHSQNSSRAGAMRLPVTKLPFVGERSDGRFGYWVLPEQAEEADPRIAGRTYAAWFLLFEEYNGQAAADDLMDRIEREMPSRYPSVDRAFLRELTSRQSRSSSAA